MKLWFWKWWLAIFLLIFLFLSVFGTVQDFKGKDAGSFVIDFLVSGVTVWVITRVWHAPDCGCGKSKGDDDKTPDLRKRWRDKF